MRIRKKMEVLLIVILIMAGVLGLRFILQSNHAPETDEVSYEKTYESKQEATTGTGYESEQDATTETSQEIATLTSEQFSPQSETTTIQKFQYTFDKSWNILTNHTLLHNCILDIEAGRVTVDCDYITIPFIEFIPETSYAFYSPSDEVRIICYDTRKQFVGGKKMSAQEGIFMDSGEYIADSKIAYFSISLPKQDLEKSLLVLNKNVMVVSVQSEFKSIQQAVANMENSGTIVIFPGIYNENVKAWGKYIELYGVNKDTCILESFSSSYYSPPLEIGAGVVKNITIRAVDRDSGASTLFAYGVHIEDHFLYDNTLLFENCDISSDFNSAVGIGLRGGCEVIFRDVSMTGKENGLFCHDSAYSSYTGLQKISLTNCVVNGLEGKQAMRFDSQGVKGAQIIVHFYNTILNNVNAITPDTLLYTQNNNGAGTDDNWMGLKNYYITHESSNNKPELLNYQ